MIQLSRFRILVALLALGFSASACLDSAPGPVAPSSTTADLVGSTTSVVEVTIGVAGGTLKVPGGHSLHFPAGALSAPTTIRAVKDGSRVQIEFGPHGLLFPESALPTLTLSYADGTGLTDADAPRLSIVYLGADGAVLERLPTTVDTQADLVRARLRHFSTYAIATD